MEYTILLWLFGLCTTDVQATTHWLVTETGLIQPRDESPFEMAQPYDLLAFLNQDTRWDNIKILYNDLSKRQIEINKLWSELEEDSKITFWLIKDKYCEKTDRLDNLNYYTSRLEDGLSMHIPQEEYQLYEQSYGEDVDVPDCKKISSLTFSMFAFEHLEAMVNRENLSINAELSLPELIAPLMTVEQFGHWVSTVLRRNTSSWLHYNMASLYWRVRGNAAKALECSRRAVHYAPRQYKDIALLSMGTVLHRANRPEDALIVLNAAHDHNPQNIEAHFTLGHAYAAVGEFNSSLKHYEETLKLNSGYEQAVNNRYGVYCVRNLVKKLQDFRTKLNILKSELREYSGRENLWIKSQAAFMRTMKHKDEFDIKNIDKIITKMAEIMSLNLKDVKKEGDKNSLILYFLEGPSFHEKWFEEKGLKAMDAAYDLQGFIQHVSQHANKATKFVNPDHKMLKVSDNNIQMEIGPLPAMPDIAKTSENTKAETQSNEKANSRPDDDIHEFEGGLPLYPSSLKVSRMKEEFDRDPLWPSEKVCKDHGAYSDENIEAIHPVFLPFENKGLRLDGLLTDKIGVSARAEHELPWHPPACPGARDAAAVLKKAHKQQLVPEVVESDYLNNLLLTYAGDGLPEHAAHMQHAEIGQRIYTTMQANLAPKWVVYTLASLYWRVRGARLPALGCLLAAGRNVRLKYKDVVLTSLASVYLEMGLFDEALVNAEEAYKLGPYEPAVNFLLSQMNMLRKQRTPQMFHLKQALRIDPGYLRGTARHLLVAWGCLLKQVNALQGFEFGEGDVCTEVQPGVSMVCNKGNVNCHVANIQCFTHSEKESTSTFVRLLQIEDDTTQPNFMDDSVFAPFIQNMPLERTDKEGHADNLHKMVAILDQLRGCGPRGCSSITAEDLALKEEDCSHQYLQLGYWLHVISFRQLISDFDVRLPSEVMSLAPSGKKVPDCRIHGDASQDFFLERLSRIEAEGWEPVISVMHQFAEMFGHQDYVTLGAKFAKYIETRGRSWTGLLGAGWWCGAGGRGACALRCLVAAHARAPAALRHHALRSLAALLLMQGKTQDAKDIAHITFYLSPQSKTEAFLVAVSNTYQEQYEQAVWMYRYALSFDERYLPAKACLHATMCIMLYGEERTKPLSLRDEL